MNALVVAGLAWRIMALSIYTNVWSSVAQRNLESANNTLGKSIERLSSGLRINHASDDASGLAVSEKLRTQISALTKAANNAQDAVSFLQTADGGMEVIGDMLQRMRELASQAGNGSHTSNDRRELQKEFEQLKAEINRVSNATEFNTKRLLSGDAAGLWSATSNDVDVIFRSAPVSGDYKLTFSTKAGENAVYQTAQLMDYTKSLVYPKGLTNIQVEGLDDVTQVHFTVNDDTVHIEPSQVASNNWAVPTTGGLQTNNIADYSQVILEQLHGVTTVFTGTVTNDGVPTTYLVDGYSYPYDNFSGFYMGYEIVSGADAVDGTTHTQSGMGNTTFINLADGTRAWQLQGGGSSSSYLRSFYVDPADGTKHYPVVFGTLINWGGIMNYRASIYTPNTNGHYNSIQYFISASAVNSMAVGDKALFYYQANSPDVEVKPGISAWTSPANNWIINSANMTYIKTVSLNIDVPNGTNIVGSNLSPKVFWDIRDPHVEFTAMTIENGEFKEIKISWDRDLNVPDDELTGGEWRWTMPTPAEVKLKDSIVGGRYVFSNDDGKKLLDNTQTLSIYGNNKNVDVYIEGEDTVADLVKKLADAIGLLGMAGDISVNNLVKIVEPNTATTTTSGGGGGGGNCRHYIFTDCANRGSIRVKVCRR
ncbi:flagellin [Deferribacterales bacterium RsTz2092]